ncbi:hypothetical protein [Amycolatopsis sp.]|uniref:hypothetical protein n=1 Tax=Amycolatopsis sp. TaxID=37632 RepID=UPI002BC8CD0C|nr:hypothetical protein [Amycolatopsis sp.]HVV14059.1 hypothetical protein [Amycolatopsis sp.]
MAFSTLADLTNTERRLVDAVLAGTELDLSTEDRPVRGEAIRSILLDGFPWPDGRSPDPRGVRLRGATIEDGLDLAEITSALPVRLVDCRTTGTVRLSGSRLSTVDLSGLAGPNVVAVEAGIERSLLLIGARLSCDSAEGVVNLGGARIGSVVDLSGSQLTNRHREGPVFHGNNLRTGSGVFLNRGFRAEGGGGLGTVRLSGAELGGQLNLTGAWLANLHGPALVADYLSTRSNLMLNQGFRAEGRHETGSIRLVGARIGGRMMCEGGHAFAVRAGDLVLNLSQAHVTGDLLLPASFTPGLLRLDGLTYDGAVRYASLAEWLEMLARRTSHYASQPYFQLAKAHRGTGHERDVRRIHVARQRDLLRRGGLDWWGRLWHRITGLTVGYGYRPAIALLWWAGVFLLAVLLIAGFAGPAGLAVRVGAAGGCSVVDQVGLALDTTVPLLKSTAQQRCQLVPDSAGGTAMVAVSWVLQALAWAFLTLFVAGFTGLVRRSS